MRAVVRSIVLLALVAGPAIAGEFMIINESELTKTIACDPKVGIVINGGENKLTLTGECAKIIVNGGENVVAIETATEIVVAGGNNKVTYQRGVGGKTPKTSNTGKGNTIGKAPEAK